MGKPVATWRPGGAVGEQHPAAHQPREGALRRNRIAGATT
jgi:hypothetical protein